MTSNATRWIMLVTLVLAAATPGASSQVREVPDIAGDGDRTVTEIRALFPDADDLEFVVVQEEPDVGGAVVQEQSPVPGKTLSVGESIHLYVGGSGGGGVGEALETAPVLYIPIVLTLVFGGWALWLKARLDDLRSRLTTSDDDDDDET